VNCRLSPSFPTRRSSDLADKVIQQPQTSILAAFGSFALLVFVEFASPPHTRFLAYVALAFAGAAFVTLGTLCSRNAWAGAGAMRSEEHTSELQSRGHLVC